MNALTYHAKIVLIKDCKFFGPGVAMLLELVEETHSLRKACGQMALAYTKALKMIQTAEEKLGYPLLVRHVGGRTGGGSELTPNAKALIRMFRAFERKAKEDIDKHFEALQNEINQLQ